MRTPSARVVFFIRPAFCARWRALSFKNKRRATAILVAVFKHSARGVSVSIVMVLSMTTSTPKRGFGLYRAMVQKVVCFFLRTHLLLIDDRSPTLVLLPGAAHGARRCVGFFERLDTLPVIGRCGRLPIVLELVQSLPFGAEQHRFDV
jgi:hypothetical protein